MGKEFEQNSGDGKVTDVSWETGVFTKRFIQKMVNQAENYYQNTLSRAAAPLEIRKAVVPYPVAPPPARCYRLQAAFTPELYEYIDKSQGGQAEDEQPEGEIPTTHITIRQ